MPRLTARRWAAAAKGDDGARQQRALGVRAGVAIQIHLTGQGESPGADKVAVAVHAQVDAGGAAVELGEAAIGREGVRQEAQWEGVAVEVAAAAIVAQGAE